MEISGVRGCEGHESDAGSIARRQGSTATQGIAGPHYRVACCEGFPRSGQAITDSSAKAGGFAHAESNALEILASPAIRDVGPFQQARARPEVVPLLRWTPVLISDL